MHPFLTSLTERLTASHGDAPDSPPGISEETALTLAELPDDAFLDLLAVARLTSSSHGASSPEPFTCGIISAKTGNCSEDCAFCAQSARHGRNASATPLAAYDAFAAKAQALSRAGAARFGIVTSGNLLSMRETDQLCEYAARLLRDFPLRLCASLGKLSPEQAARLREAGFTRYHHNIETAPSYYPAICTTHTPADRFAAIAVARRAGLEICSGGIFGMGESRKQRVEMAFALRHAGVDSLPLNFLRPIPGTPLAGRPPLAPQEALRCIALFRLIHPTRDIVICGGREFTLGPWQPFVFAAGANAIMIGDYLTTPGSGLQADQKMLAVLGMRGKKK